MKFSRYPYRIIKVVQTHIDELIKNPKHLAWCLLHYELMHLACRYEGYDTDNPKYVFGESENWPSLNESQSNILYDAWAVTVSCDIPNDECGDCTPHINMTLDDWINLFQNPEYQYHNLHESREDIITYLLCCSGNGFKWTKDGYIAMNGDQIDEAIYYGYSQSEKEINPKIANKIKKICNNKKFADTFNLLYKRTVKFNQLTGSQKRKVKDIMFDIRAYDKEEKKKDIKKWIQKTIDIIDGVKEGKPTEFFSPTLGRVEKIVKKHAALFKEEQQAKVKPTKIVIPPFDDKYSNLSNIPDNAHPSYIKEAVKIAKLIINDDYLLPLQKEDKHYKSIQKTITKVSKSVLAKWEPMGC